ncbi:hypothetical protein ACJ41O_009391 [Fusarium nematophilum]
MEDQQARPSTATSTGRSSRFNEELEPTDEFSIHPRPSMQTVESWEMPLGGGPTDDEPPEVSSFVAPISGYFKESYRLKGDQYHASAQADTSETEEIRADYEDLWLSIQLWWDLLLRMQPNSVTDDLSKTTIAVDLMLDTAVGRLLPEVREYPHKLARRNIRDLQRRLRRQELELRADMNTCGLKPPKILCGCLIGVKRPAKKQNIWTRLFGSKPQDMKRQEDRNFRARDVAGLIRIEDFLTFVSRDFDRQLGRPWEGEEGVQEDTLVVTAIGFLDDEIKDLLPKKDYRTALELRADWVYVLCNRRFRNAVIREVNALVAEGVSFYKKQGHEAHRQECELWAPPAKGLARILSSSVPPQKDGKPEPPPKRPSFWTLGSKSGK